MPKESFVVDPLEIRDEEDRLRSQSLGVTRSLSLIVVARRHRSGEIGYHRSEQ